MDLGFKIKNIRIKLGDNMEDFGKRIKPLVTKGTVSNWEKGKYTPNSDRLKQIAELGNITVEELTKDGGEVQQMRDENRKLREALQKIVDDEYLSYLEITEIAQKALEK